MVNEIVQREHVCVVQRDYDFRMVNDHKQIHKVEHPKTKQISITIQIIDRHLTLSVIPRRRLSRVNMEDICRVPELHNYLEQMSFEIN